MAETPYIVSARKYRPATFKSVVGQKNLTSTLKNAIDSDRLAQAYLFCGPRGVGKTSCARIFAKTINCLSPTPDGEACGVCESCKAIDEGNSFNIIELDAASNNSVNDIRNITEQVNIPPTTGKYRVFIIDEVHMLTSQAFNAFLKTLEEPPAYVIFILATTEKHKVIPTILSRCQIYDFKRITIQDMVEHLHYVAECENISADSASLNVIARKADGAMRDALSIFDQVAASSFGNITYESTIASLDVLDYEYYFRLVDAFRAGDVPTALLLYKEIRDRGFDTLFFINGLASHIRDLMVAFSPQTASLLEVADDIAARYTEQAKSLPVDWHYAAIKILNDCDFKYRTASNKQLLAELTLVRLCQLLNPPTAPFDSVDNDYLLPLRDIVVPPSGLPSQESISVAQSPAQPKVMADPYKSDESPDASEPSSTETSKPESPKPDEPQKQSKKGRSAAFRISNIDESNDDSAPTEQHEPLQPETLRDAWEDFIYRHPTLQILTSTMSSCRPSIAADDKIAVTIFNDMQRTAFEKDMSTLISFLRQQLHNDTLSIDISIDTSKAPAKQMLPQDLLKLMVESNPSIAEMLGTLDMEII